MKNPARLFIRIPAVFAAALACVSGASLEINTSHPDGTYTMGEAVVWSVSATDDPDSQIKCIHYKITRDGGPVLRQSDINLRDGSGEITIKADQPGVLLVELNASGDGHTEPHLFGGALVDPGCIPRSAPRPADFDAFWNGKLAEMAKVPANAQVVAEKTDRDGVSCFQITMDLPRGQKMHGQLARPAAGERFPAMIVFQYAGVYALPPGKVTPQASRGWLALNISAHDLPIDESEQFYRDQDNGPLKHYPMIGNEDREKSYFLRMFLACSRAVDYLAARPDWDGRTLVVTGNSQGGLQSIVAAGLNPKVTALVVNVPAGCDTTAPLVGRPVPWPYWFKSTTARTRDAVMRTSCYFDAQNFAQRVKCPALVSFGLLDRTATASGVSVMARQLGGPVERLVLTKAEHQNKGGAHHPFEVRSGQWFTSLLTSGRPPAPPAE